MGAADRGGWRYDYGSNEFVNDRREIGFDFSDPGMPEVPEMFELRAYGKRHPFNIPRIPKDAPWWYKYVEGGAVAGPGVALAGVGGGVALTYIGGTSAYATAMTAAGSETGQEIIKLGKNIRDLET